MGSSDGATVDGILRQARTLEGKRLLDRVDGLDPALRSGVRTKGRVGHIYERFFGIPPNSLSEPDFALAGVELKIVPMVGPPGGRRVKERTFITQINYGRIQGEAWRGSHLDRKSRQVLFIFYEWDRLLPIAEFRTLKVHLWERGRFDAILLRSAHDYVKRRVASGEAHLISEADTQAIGAATKGAGGRMVGQPNSDVLARPRAFAFKPSFTQAIWKSLDEPLPSIGVAQRVRTPRGAEEAVRARTHRFEGMSVSNIAKELGHPASSSKNWLAMLSRRMLGAPKGRRDVEELVKLGVTVRTLRVDEIGRPREDVSFRAVDYLELATERWEAASLREEISHLFFMVFRQPRDLPLLEARYEGSFFWRPNVTELAAIESEWLEFRRAVRASRMDQRPQASETTLIHMRPHGRDSDDVLLLPDGSTWVRSSFWLNKDFLCSLILRRLP